MILKAKHTKKPTRFEFDEFNLYPSSSTYSKKASLHILFTATNPQSSRLHFESVDVVSATYLILSSSCSCTMGMFWDLYVRTSFSRAG